ncbi:AraC family transcriptional regulator [Emticicia sp. 21SJ11W-3]|uniref:helix-turn-helix domain-containing protein n=1 Tax=Emticicia sp. 21SJ11W-3 TaxID=2916755 RepID=UPI00209C7169|nr:helix-turn-helix domain-containing protein [Emticicia sp. 21SJ11W-3]UTA70075.1 AraC family transcriptional regulator [Emticicia sp. 21SJ11W-3]
MSPTNQIPIVDICNLTDFREDDILVSRFADYLKAHHNLCSAHRHTFYHLLLFTKGGGSHTIDFSNFPVIPYQIYFMVPGQVHSWSFEGEVDGYVINFSTSFFQSFLLRPDYLESFSFFNGIAEDGVIQLQDEIKDTIIHIFEETIRQLQQNNTISRDLVRVLLLQAFIEIEKHTQVYKLPGVPAFNYTLLKNFQKLVEKQYISLKRPMDYAGLLYITPNHLNALCKEHLGITAGEVIRNRILLEAKRMLVNQNQSISEISYALNFSDNSYFTKFFKKYEGITPEEFRKKTSQVQI